MKKNSDFKALPCNRNGMPLIFLILLSSLFFCSNIFAADKASRFYSDTTAEKKVDYLERIYFSGEDKAGLNENILITLQELQEKSPTPALAKQVTFLIDIQDDANAAKNACEVLDLLAVGIYNIDAAEAKLQGVQRPSDKAKTKSVNALASIQKLNSTANSLSSNASNLAWSSYLLSGGKYGTFASGAGKVANGAAKFGNTLGAVGQAAETGKQVIGIAKGFGADKLFKKKDKACNDVDKKDIVIGEHGAAPAKTATTEKAATALAGTETQTVVNITSVSNSLLRSFTDTIKTKPGVRSAEKTYNETLSTVTVFHTGTTDNLADWIEDKLGSKFKLGEYGPGKINLTPKQ
jgi:hypothetical protein